MFPDIDLVNKFSFWWRLGDGYPWVPIGTQPWKWKFFYQSGIWDQFLFCKVFCKTHLKKMLIFLDLSWKIIGMQKFSHPKSIPHGDSPGYGESCDNLTFWLLSWARGQVVKKLKIKVQKHAKKKIFENWKSNYTCSQYMRRYGSCPNFRSLSLSKAEKPASEV